MEIMMRQVFVTQIPNRRDRESGAWVPVFDISPAADFGEINVLMPSTTSIYETTKLVGHLREKLGAYNYDRGDFIVMAGDPAVIAVAASVLATKTPRYRILKWEREQSIYIPVEVEL